MNNLAKNLLLWLIIAVVLMTVFNNFNNHQTAPKDMEYSQFYTQLNNGQIDKVTIEGRVITGTTKANEKFSTYSPETDNRLLIGDLLKNGVNVEGKPPQEQPLWLQILISWAPMLLLIGFWF